MDYVLNQQDVKSANPLIVLHPAGWRDPLRTLPDLEPDRCRPRSGDRSQVVPSGITKHRRAGGGRLSTSLAFFAFLARGCSLSGRFQLSWRISVRSTILKKWGLVRSFAGRKATLHAGVFDATLLGLFVLVLSSRFAIAEEPTWSQWRGPTRDGIVQGPAWPTSSMKPL